MGEKLVLIDGHSILNRAFYGVPDLSNAQGLHTNAVYGFLNILFKIIEEEQPGYLAVAFDVKAPTFRHELYREYKGTRKPMPQELHEQVPIMKEVLRAMGILIMEQAGLEADDILGAMAKRAEAAGMDVSLVSGDRDLLQIATERIRIRIPKTKGGKTQIEDYYAKDVLAKYHVTPLQFIDLKALMGDASDNIPGVPKIGEKTAAELIASYGSLENIYAHVQEIPKKSIRESLEANRELADLSKVLATIRTECGLPYTLQEAAAGNFYTKEAYVLFKKLEFKNMLARFDNCPDIKNDQTSQYITVTGQQGAKELFDACQHAQRTAFFIVNDGERAQEFFGIAVCFAKDAAYFLPCAGELTSSYLTKEMAKTAAVADTVYFDIKKAYPFLGVKDAKGMFDVLIAAYLLNPLKSDYSLEDIAGEHLGMVVPSKGELFGKDSFASAYGKDPKQAVRYACMAAQVLYAAAGVLDEKLKETQMDALFYEIEMPLSLVLYEMEQEGVKVKPDELKAYGGALASRIVQLEEAIHKQAGEDFNINSPKQLGEILFGKLGLPGGKKTKTGYSTAADVLEKLAQDHPIVSDILEYRGLVKLKSTYADGLFAYIGADDRIHTTFRQTITATGRLSSMEPNLQNIPMRTELGRLIRKVFIPKDGYVFLDADYSQIELRILAHMSADRQLIEAYRMEEDIHRITAAKVFHTPCGQVTDLQRRNAKAVNFGIVYGISSFGLSQDLSITKKEAADYIEEYFKTYPQVKRFLDKTVEDAKACGYVVTMFGRRRPIPELKSENFMQRSFGERAAMNSPIQGTAADIMKIAMIRVWRALKEAGLQSRLILQIHDELLIETKQSEIAQVKKILADNMRQAAQLEVALEIDLHEGLNWYEAK